MLGPVRPRSGVLFYLVFLSCCYSRLGGSRLWPQKGPIFLRVENPHFGSNSQIFRGPIVWSLFQLMSLGPK